MFAWWTRGFSSKRSMTSRHIRVMAGVGLRGGPGLCSRLRQIARHTHPLPDENTRYIQVVSIGRERNARQCRGYRTQAFVRNGHDPAHRYAVPQDTRLNRRRNRSTSCAVSLFLATRRNDGVRTHGRSPALQHSPHPLRFPRNHLGHITPVVSRNHRPVR